MPKGPVRRSQLIAPFGVGAMLTNRDGISLIACGLDHWFEREDEESSSIDDREFVIREWRLEKLLGVTHFRFPPDYRTKLRGQDVPEPQSVNYYLTVPFLRFPQWHYCPDCRLLKKYPLTVRESRVLCPKCQIRNKNRYLVQVSFVAMCQHGHIQDFPWLEWVHHSASPSCRGPLRLISTGAATLAGQKVVCESCKKERSLEGITLESAITDNLEPGNKFPCAAITPWLGSEEGHSCSEPLRGSLRSASNVYYAKVRSSLYIPQGSARQEEILAILDKPDVSTFITLLRDAGVSPTAAQVRKQFPLAFTGFGDSELQQALDKYGERVESSGLTEGVGGDDQETAFRRDEFSVLCTQQSLNDLRIRSMPLENYNGRIAEFFSRIQLIEKLRETRALAGFARVFPENDLTPGQLISLLWKDLPERNRLWLPAYVVHGEGIFLQLSEDRLQEWSEQHRDILEKRLRPLRQNYSSVCERRHLGERVITARFVLVHTVSHLLINQLTFECGYSSASLRERLYVSENPSAQMAAVLIYTAAGDAEGTMGGLVRMGKSGYFESLFQRVMDKAEWCSADPVCMELGESGGQGPDSCNLAACHNCALVPETACEEFNRFLDRATVIGSLSHRKLGYFTLGEK